jgi:hypothetical protein
MKKCPEEVWFDIERELKERHRVLAEAQQRISDHFTVGDAEIALTLAATDIFVEHAQRYLTSRGKWFLWAGAALMSFAVVFLCLIYYVEFHLETPFTTEKALNKQVAATVNITPNSLTPPLPPKEIQNSSRPSGSATNNQTGEDVQSKQDPRTNRAEKRDLYLVIFELIKLFLLTIISLSVAYFGLDLARACLHEGSALFQRRHALRFGKLFVYIKKKNITIDELNTAFQWHAQAETAFHEIKSDSFARSLLGRLIEKTSDIFSAGLEKVKETKKGIPRPGGGD